MEWGYAVIFANWQDRPAAAIADLSKEISIGSFLNILIGKASMLRNMLYDRLPNFVRSNYYCREWHSASAILASDFPSEWQDIIDVLECVSAEEILHHQPGRQQWPDGKVYYGQCKRRSIAPVRRKEVSDYSIPADPPWQFQNRTGKMAPEHKRLSRYPTMSLDDICDLPVKAITGEAAHLYLWVPNAMLPQGRAVMDGWGFQYKSNIVWYKIPQGWRSGSAGSRFLFPQCNRNSSIRSAGHQCADAGSGTIPGEHNFVAKTRAQPKARRGSAT